MKQRLTVLFIIAVFFASAQNKDKIEIIVGVHSGVYSSIYSYGNYYHVSAYQGDKFSRENLSGFALPVNAELLFDINNFRTGVRVEYAAGLYFQQGSYLHSGNVMACFEYAFKVKPKLTIAPLLCAGFAGVTYQDNEAYGRPVSETGYVVKGSLNFEMGYKQVKFTVSPTYSFSDLWGTGLRKSKSQLHMFGVNLGARFLLRKPTKTITPSF